MGSRVGQVLASKYRLDELLGSGGMGHVYRALNVRAGRTVAIKILRTEHATNTPIVDRFLREALAANLVRHPNVVDVLDVDKDEDGAPFIVQELLDGEDLAKYVDRRGGRLNLEEIEMYLVPVIDAVAEAHARGVVHRDIKPENVFLATQGTKKIPKLLDFGISKVRLPDIKATEVGVMMGTPAYMAPEQVQGSRDADPRTDVWALGIMLFELLAGRLPYDAVDAPALFVAIATKDAERLRDVDPTIDPNVARVVERCLRRAPDQRYPSASELARDMRHVLAGVEPEPTLRRSIPPAALRGTAPFEVPDLALPVKATAEPFELKRKAAETIRDAPAHYEDTEYQSPRQHTAPLLSSSGASPPTPPPRDTALEDSGRFAPAVAAASRGPGSASAGPVVAAGSASVSAASSSRMAVDQVLPGVMLAGSSTSTQRRGPYAPAQPPVRESQDMSFVVGLAVVGLVGLGTTAVLSGVFPQPGGFAVLPLVMKPVPSQANLVVQAALAIGGLFVAGKIARGGMRRWSDELPGGRGGAVFFAVLAGAFLFAAVQLGRAAW
ncbi:MAG: protein kinase [Labilithrix sp.]|nr:protein kinase [Labilithrix sp.]MCW5810715.1 protein kinase [Labilithrix sp.]